MAAFTSALDKTNGYDFFYRQNVIKPALVGLAGPWISGGVEFNWPQHHRPATFMPVEIDDRRARRRIRTVWCSDHDPMKRMKGMHGVCLHPGKAYRRSRRCGFTTARPCRRRFYGGRTWRRGCTKNYQSFFPPDVRYVADHAKRAISAFPQCEGRTTASTMGARSTFLDEERRAVRPDGTYPPNDLSWYCQHSRADQLHERWVRAKISSAATITRDRLDSSTLRTITSRRAKSSGRGATTNSAMHGTAA